VASAQKKKKKSLKKKSGGCRGPGKELPVKENKKAYMGVSLQKTGGGKRKKEQPLEKIALTGRGSRDRKKKKKRKIFLIREGRYMNTKTCFPRKTGQHGKKMSRIYVGRGQT